MDRIAADYCRKEVQQFIKLQCFTFYSKDDYDSFYVCIAKWNWPEMFIYKRHSTLICIFYRKKVTIKLNKYNDYVFERYFKTSATLNDFVR